MRRAYKNRVVHTTRNESQQAAPVSALRNLGPRMEQHLREVGIGDAATLRAVGYMEAYLRLRFVNPRVMNRMALYALYGALHDEDCMKLSNTVKQALEAKLQAALRE